MVVGKPTVVWTDRAANRTSANGTLAPYTLVTLRCYVTAECASVYPALDRPKIRFPSRPFQDSLGSFFREIGPEGLS
jgi:hypothetical protein